MQELTRTSGETSPTGPAPAAADAGPDSRPGVPREAEPRPDPGAQWARPPRQSPTVTVLRRKGLDELTPVFGTGQPPHGLSGLIRRLAYLAPEHKARHWGGLLLADRVDVLESRLGRALSRPLRKSGPTRTARFVEQNALALLATSGIACYLLLRGRRRRNRQWPPAEQR